MMNHHYDLIYTVKDRDEFTTVKGALKNRKGVSTRLIRQIKNGRGAVYLNGEPTHFGIKIQPGDVVSLAFPTEESEFAAEDIPLDILYEDEDILLINKQPFAVVHPTKGHQSGTIANALMYHMDQTGNRFKIRFINRLDRDTSGVLLVGKNAHSQTDFAAQAKRGEVNKIYRAIVHGHLADDEGTIDLPIDRDDEGHVKRIVREDGYESITHYKVLQRYTSRENHKFSYIELRLETGRTHQIRVHLSHIGYPIVGDSLYAEEYFEE
ncbi:MAG: RluA family pseudouridine synthase, partial [Clostridiales Family XIII bacterium]|nr:RluA family pseudouridine synthase [Clostridiales Family XIII bacterium]